MNTLNKTPNENQKKEETKTDFELPDVSEEGAKMAPRIHKGPQDSTCVSCEG
jgi:hypothetical protein